jgi:hypothetical protein
MGSNNPTPPATLIPCNTGKYMIAPLGSNLSFLGYGPTSTVAQQNAVNLATITGPAQGLPPRYLGTAGRRAARLHPRAEYVFLRTHADRNADRADHHHPVRRHVNAR